MTNRITGRSKRLGPATGTSTSSSTSDWRGLSLALASGTGIGSGIPVPFDTLYEDSDGIRSSGTYDFGLGTIPVGGAGVVPSGMAGRWRLGTSATISLDTDDNPANLSLYVNASDYHWQASWYTSIDGDDSLPSQLLLNIVPRVVTLAEGDVVWGFVSTGSGNGELASAPYDTVLLMEYLGPSTCETFLAVTDDDVTLSQAYVPGSTHVRSTPLDGTDGPLVTWTRDAGDPEYTELDAGAGIVSLLTGFTPPLVRVVVCFTAA